MRIVILKQTEGLMNRVVREKAKQGCEFVGVR